MKSERNRTNRKQLIKFHVSVVMNSNKIGRDLSYDSKDFFFSDSHILTVSIISIFAVVLAILGVCFFFKICEYKSFHRRCLSFNFKQSFNHTQMVEISLTMTLQDSSSCNLLINTVKIQNFPYQSIANNIIRL